MTTDAARATAAAIPGTSGLRISKASLRNRTNTYSGISEIDDDQINVATENMFKAILERKANVVW